MENVFNSIVATFIEQDPKTKKCNRKNKIKFEDDISCINEELEYKEIGSSYFQFDSCYKNDTNYFKNIYIDEFKHEKKRSVDLLTLAQFKGDKKGKLYFIEVKSNLVCYRWDEVKSKIEDTIEKIDSIEEDNFISSAIVIGQECDENKDNSAITNKMKKQIEDIEFLDMPLGKVSIYPPNTTIKKELEHKGKK